MTMSFFSSHHCWAYNPPLQYIESVYRLLVLSAMLRRLTRELPMRIGSPTRIEEIGFSPSLRWHRVRPYQAGIAVAIAREWLRRVLVLTFFASAIPRASCTTRGTARRLPGALVGIPRTPDGWGLGGMEPVLRSCRSGYPEHVVDDPMSIEIYSITIRQRTRPWSVSPSAPACLARQVGVAAQRPAQAQPVPVTCDQG